MDTNEIKTLKDIIRECPFLGFHGGGISDSDDWTLNINR